MSGVLHGRKPNEDNTEEIHFWTYDSDRGGYVTRCEEDGFIESDGPEDNPNLLVTQKESFGSLHGYCEKCANKEPKIDS